MKCIRCGVEDTKENPVIEAPDPFQQEIHGDDTKLWECDECRQKSADDI